MPILCDFPDFTFDSKKPTKKAKINSFREKVKASKTAVFKAFYLSEPLGTRTRDNLIKSQNGHTGNR